MESKTRGMSDKSLQMKMNENYGEILIKMTPSEREWAENFEKMEYAIERGHSGIANTLRETLSGEKRNDEIKTQIIEAIDVKVRTNPKRVQAEKLRANKKKKTDNIWVENQYDPSDFIDQRFNASGYELAVSVSPEDAIVEALDAARAANVSLEDLLFGNVVITKQRGRGRPKKESI